MADAGAPRARIIFVPGKNPKPRPEDHREYHWRCLLEGVRRADPAVHAELVKAPEVFDLIPWNFSYYGAYRDISGDLPWIEEVLTKQEATPADMRAARNWRLKVALLSYLIADLMPVLINLITDARIKATVVETVRYFENRDGIAEIVRAPLLKSIREACELRMPILVIGHSLGSVIAYDALWLLSHADPAPCTIDLFLTLGSPLGSRYVQKRLLGHDAAGRSRYPTNIRHWCNISAVGDLTAFDPKVRDDFHEMLDLKIIEEIRDYERPVYNWFRTDQGMNFHRSYGYFANPAMGGVIADWWRERVVREGQRS